METPEVKITQVVVEAAHKSWGSQGSGNSGGTTISWTVVPPAEKKEWTVKEAHLVTLSVRTELHRMLLADAMARGTVHPDGRQGALIEYNKIAETFNGGAPPSDTGTG
jgi:hypothetical protein